MGLLEGEELPYYVSLAWFPVVANPVQGIPDARYTEQPRFVPRELGRTTFFIGYISISSLSEDTNKFGGLHTRLQNFLTVSMAARLHLTFESYRFRSVDVSSV